jgi:hypothetical protein
LFWFEDDVVGNDVDWYFVIVGYHYLAGVPV